MKTLKTMRKAAWRKGRAWVIASVCSFLAIVSFAVNVQADDAAPGLPQISASAETPNVNIVTGPTSVTVTAEAPAVVTSPWINVGQGYSVSFQGPSFLWRDLGPRASEINGNVSASNFLAIQNPNGIHIGPNAQITANTFIATTLAISTNNFVNGNYVFERGPDSPYAQVFNQGRIEATNIALLASAVKNSGIITARVGVVHMATGDRITMSLDPRGLIQVVVDEKTTGKAIDLETGETAAEAIANTATGSIEAHKVIMQAGTAADAFENAINLKGVVRATRLVEENGVIRVVADGNIKVSGKLTTEGDTSIEAARDLAIYGDITTTDGDLSLIADSDLDGIGTFTQAAGTTVSTTGSGGITIRSSGNATVANIISAGDITLTRSGADAVFSQTEDSVVTAAGSLNINTGVTLKAANTVYAVARDWRNEGTFIADLSKVRLVGEDPSTVYGDNVFNDFEVTTPGKPVKFEAGKTQTVEGVLVLRGEYGKLVIISSTVPGDAWYLLPERQTDIIHISLRDCHNIRGPPLEATSSGDSGNNTNIIFPPTYFTVAGDQVGPLGAGHEIVLTITAYDAEGRVLVSYSGDKTLVFSGARPSPNNTIPKAVDDSGIKIVFGQDTSVTFNSGVASVSIFLYNAESAHINAASGQASSSIDPSFGYPITIIDPPADHFVLSATPDDPFTAGGSFTLTITATDEYGNTDTTYIDSHDIYFSGADASLSGDAPTASDNADPSNDIAFGNATSLTFTAGVATTTIKLYCAQGVTIGATDNTISQDATIDLTVNPGESTKLWWNPQPPDTATVDAEWSTFDVILGDDYGNNTGVTSGTVSLSDDGTGMLTNNTADLISGTAEFVSVRYDTVETIHLTASYAGYDPIVSDGTSVQEEPPPAVSYFAFSGQTEWTAGDTNDITITAYDGDGNPVDYSGPHIMNFSGVGTSRGGDVPQVNGQTIYTSGETPRGITLEFSGSDCTFTLQLFCAQSGALFNATEPSTGISASGYELSVNVSAGSATNLWWNVQPPANVEKNATWSEFSVVLGDGYGNNTGEDGIDVTLSHNGSGTLSNDTATTSGGVATFSTESYPVSYDTNETINLVASASGYSDSPASDNIRVGPPYYFGITGAANWTAGNTKNVTITCYNLNGTEHSYTGSHTMNFSGVNTSPNGTIPTVNGNGIYDEFGDPQNIDITFSGASSTISLSLFRAENVTFNATEVGTEVSSSGHGLAVSVAAGPTAGLSGLSWQTAPPTGAPVNYAWDTFSVYASAGDAYGNPTGAKSGASVTIQLASGTGALGGTLTATTGADGIATFNNVDYNTVEGITVQGSSSGYFTEESGGIEITEVPGYFVLSSEALSWTAGDTNSVTITAYSIDDVEVSFTGPHVMNFSGVSTSPNGTIPQVDGNDIYNESGDPQNITLTFSGSSCSFTLSVFKSEDTSFNARDTQTGTTATGHTLDISVQGGGAVALWWNVQPPAAATTDEYWSEFSVSLGDNYGNETIPESPIEVTLVSDGTEGGLTGNTAMTGEDGIARFTELTYSAAETIHLTATASGLTESPASDGTEVRDLPSPSYFGFSAVANWTAGEAKNITITCYDQYGNPIGYPGEGGVSSMQFSGAESINGYIPKVNGLDIYDEYGNPVSIGLVFSGSTCDFTLQLYKAQDVNFNASDSVTGLSAGGHTLDVTVGAAAGSTLTTLTWNVAPPATAVAGCVWTEFSVSATGDDAYGNSGAVMSGTEVDLEVTSGPGVLSGTTSKNTASNGIATFSDIRCNTSEVEIKIDAYNGDIHSAESDTISISALPSYFTVTTGAGGWTAGVEKNITITAYDADGNVTAYPGPHTMNFYGANDSPNGTIPKVGGEDIRDGSGNPNNIDITFTGNSSTFAITLFCAETASFYATDVNTAVSAAGHSLGANVSAGASAGLYALSWNAQPPTIAAQDRVWSSFSVYAQSADIYGNDTGPQAGESITVELSSGSGTLDGTLSRTTGADGIATFSDITYDKEETITLDAYNGAISAGNSDNVEVTNTYTWTNGNGTGIWSDAANWNVGYAPGTGNGAIFDGGTAVDNASIDVNDLTLTGLSLQSGYTGTVSVNATGFSVDGEIILASGTLDSKGAIISVSGDWTKTEGDFICGAGTVIFNGSNQVISGDNTFYNFTKTNAGTLTFNEGDTQTISGKMTVTGTSGSKITLNKTGATGTNYWNMSVSSGSYDLQYLNVSDSNNTGAIIYAPNSTVSAHCIGWVGTPRPVPAPPAPAPYSSPTVMSGESVLYAFNRFNDNFNAPGGYNWLSNFIQTYGYLYGPQNYTQSA